MTDWIVTLTSIEWDDGKGAYDVSGLPSLLVLSVAAETRADAVEEAMSLASDEFGSLINGCSTIVIPAGDD